MKNYPILIVIVAMLFSATANAKIWRVNNNGYSADFATLKAANDNGNVLAGDTLHLEASNKPYPGITLTKQLIIIGPGYFLEENPNVSSAPYSALISENYAVQFNAGSSGSQIIGVDIDGYVYLNVGDITIKRCRLTGTITLYKDYSNVRIVQNIFTKAYNVSGSAFNVSNNGFPTDVVFNNNICQRQLIAAWSSEITYTLLECNNNVFDFPATDPTEVIRLNTGSFRNNILTSPFATVYINNGNYSNVTHNISSSANNQFGTGNNNIVLANMTNLFVGETGNTTDGKYRLKAGSPGSSNGSDGTDRGPFGGAAISNRYTLSGLAPIPVIYQINTTGVATPAALLPVTIKARTIQ